METSSGAAEGQQEGTLRVNQDEYEAYIKGFHLLSGEIADLRDENRAIKSRLRDAEAALREIEGAMYYNPPMTGGQILDTVIAYFAAHPEAKQAINQGPE